MSDAPERIWAGTTRQHEWDSGLWYDFNFGSDCEEYLRLDLHTAALADRDARITALEAGLRDMLAVVDENLDLSDEICHCDPPCDDVTAAMFAREAYARARDLLDGGKATP